MIGGRSTWSRPFASLLTIVAELVLDFFAGGMVVFVRVRRGFTFLVAADEHLQLYLVVSNYPGNFGSGCLLSSL